MQEKTETKLVINKTEYRLSVGNVILNIGKNDVPVDDLEKAKAHPVWKVWKNEGMIAEGKTEEGEQIPDDSKDITKLNADNAIAVIEATFEKAQLENWLEQEMTRTDREPRKTVIKALEEQIEAEDGPAVGNAKNGTIRLNEGENNDKE